jgi:hypothetical protein
MAKKTIWEVNGAQLIMLFAVCFVIFMDKLSLLQMYWEGAVIYQLADGWSEAIKNIIYLIIVLSILVSMKYKTDKMDFIVVSLFSGILFFSLSAIGIGQIGFIGSIAFVMMCYSLFSIQTKKRTLPKSDDRNMM